MTVVGVAIPLLADAVVVAVVVTPLCGESERVRGSRELLGNVAVVETPPFAGHLMHLMLILLLIHTESESSSDVTEPSTL